MRVGFFIQDNSDRTDGFGHQLNAPKAKYAVHVDLAHKLIESVHKTMPGVEVWQLTDHDTKRIEAADGIKRLAGIVPMAVRRMTLHGLCEGDWLFCDTDIVIAKDVRPMFDEKFDICLTDRIGTKVAGSEYGKKMPYNIGVVFSRSPRFWNMVVEDMQQIPLKYQEWTGDQLVIGERMNMGMYESSGFTMKILPGRIYNYSPEFPGDEPPDVAIFHFKGGRKVFNQTIDTNIEVCSWE